MSLDRVQQDRNFTDWLLLSVAPEDPTVIYDLLTVAQQDLLKSKRASRIELWMNASQVVTIGGTTGGSTFKQVVAPAGGTWVFTVPICDWRKVTLQSITPVTLVLYLD